MLTSDSYLFIKYADEYGIIRNDGSIHSGELIGVRDDAPEEVKKSWEEFLKNRERDRELGLA